MEVSQENRYTRLFRGVLRVRRIAGLKAASALLGSLALGAMVLFSSLQASEVSLEPDLDQPAKRVTPRLFGTHPANRSINPGSAPVTPPEDSTVVDCPECDQLMEFDPANFSDPRDIDNRWMPLKPGMEMVFKGVANRGGGLLNHDVIFIVTDVVKEIAGIPCITVFDRDINEGDLKEAELAFFAQDNFGNVWLMGEYPEEYEGGVLLGAENTWISELEGAIPGVIIPQVTKLGSPGFRQALALENDFWDCGQVEALGDDDGDDDDDDKTSSSEDVCTPIGCFDDWLLVREWAPLEGCDVIQTKTYVEHKGVVLVGAIDDPEGETLTLQQINRLTRAQLAEANAAALELDTRGYWVKPELYADTEPAYVAGDEDDDDDDDDDDDGAEEQGNNGPGPVTSTDLRLLGLDDLTDSRGANYFVCITDEATGAGMQLGALQNGFSKPQALVALNPGTSSERLLAVDDGRLVQINPASGTGTVIGPIGDSSISGMAFHPKTGVLYAITRNTNRLLRIDPSTGAGTVVATDVLEGYRPEDITFHPDGRAFVLTGPTPRVFEIDLKTGKRVQRWELTGGKSMESLAWSPDGNTLYSAADRSGREDLVRINLSNATIEFVGAGRSGGHDVHTLTWVSPAMENLLMSSTLEPITKSGAAQVLTTLSIGPNPVRGSAEIAYSVTQSGLVQLEIYDVAGRRVRSLVSQVTAPGSYSVHWNARDGRGNDVAAGVYYSRLRTPYENIVKRIVVSK